MQLNLEDLSNEQRQIAETIGLEAYIELTRRFGGTSIYVAKAEEICKRIDRDERIREEFNGENYTQLAAKYGLTEVWIRNIVYDKAVEIKRKPIAGQMNLLDFIEE